MKTGKPRIPLVVPLLVFLTALAVLWGIGPCVSTAAASTDGITVVLDAGHGGADGGATGRSGTSEKKLNLEIAAKTEAFLRFFGIPVVMTRTDDRSLHSPQAQTLREQKSEDLRKRCEMAQTTPNALYVAVHQNFHTDTVSRGAQVFYAADNDGGRRLAEAMQANIRSSLPQAGTRDAAVLPNANYIMQHLSCPAVILECGFLSHPEEEMLLCNPQYQTKLAFCVAATILDLAEQEYGF